MAKLSFTTEERTRALALQEHGGVPEGEGPRAARREEAAGAHELDQLRGALLRGRDGGCLFRSHSMLTCSSANTSTNSLPSLDHRDGGDSAADSANTSTTSLPSCVRSVSAALAAMSLR